MPTMRIHFSSVDLGRTRLALQIDHMWEIISSVQVLQHRAGGLFFDNWRRRVRERVRTDGQLQCGLRTLMDLAPHARYFPDFLTPVDEIDDVGTAFDAVLSTSKTRLRAEITRLGMPAVRLRDLANGEIASLRGLRGTLDRYYRAVVLPHLDEITLALRADLAERVNIYLRDGVEAVLADLSPVANWNHPVLTMDYPVERDLWLAGRGLRLVPSYYCLHHPVALADPSLRPILVFPVRPLVRLLNTEHRRGDRLSALLGNTRAEILRLLIDGSNTKDLVRRLGVAPATVSHHTTVLRDAGMIATHRHGTFATHMVTPLGLRMLSEIT